MLIRTYVLVVLIYLLLVLLQVAGYILASTRPRVSLCHRYTTGMQHV